MKTYIIAEAGVNHNGDIKLAKEMVHAAKKAGASCIKFETFVTEELVTPYASKAQYQKENLNSSDETQFEMLKKYELNEADYYELKELCKKENIDFLSTPFDLESIKILERVDMPVWKIPSGEITNFPYLKRLAETGKPIFLSTGMTDLSEISWAINVLGQYGCGNITLLHCNSQYPTPFIDANLKAIQTLRERFNLPVGYSDHTLGIEAAVAAVALGAVIIEKHFTLDKSQLGPDHKMSIDEMELKELVYMINNVEMALGSGEKRPSESERSTIVIARKSIVAARDIRKGEIIKEKDIKAKRPGYGISPIFWEDIIGQSAKRDFKENEMIEV